MGFPGGWCPGEERIEQRDESGAVRQPLVGRGEASLILDDIELGDLIESCLGDGRFRRLPHVEDGSAAVGPAGDLGDRRHRGQRRAGFPRLVERCEPAVGIGLQKAREVREMGRRVLAGLHTPLGRA